MWVLGHCNTRLSVRPQECLLQELHHCSDILLSLESEDMNRMPEHRSGAWYTDAFSTCHQSPEILRFAVEQPWNNAAYLGNPKFT
uniref:Uncharacterized protein n=1 Tax=Arundo donax TaxID=35708 RepID=A0A0A8Y421_ARUDO